MRTEIGSKTIEYVGRRGTCAADVTNIVDALEVKSWSYE
jgi:hypothetical protein